MTELVNHLVDGLVVLAEQIADVGEPSLVILVNTAIVLAAVALILGRLRAEKRSQAWNTLTVEERREKIMDILREAFETAEWLYSHLSPADQAEKKLVADKKKAHAVKYAKAELSAMGASGADLMTVPLRLERVCDLRKTDRARYSTMRRERV